MSLFFPLPMSDQFILCEKFRACGEKLGRMSHPSQHVCRILNYSEAISARPFQDLRTLTRQLMILFLFQEENESDQTGLLYTAMNNVTPTSVCPQNIHIAGNTGNVLSKAPLIPRVPSFAIEWTEEALVKAPSSVDMKKWGVSMTAYYLCPWRNKIRTALCHGKPGHHTESLAEMVTKHLCIPLCLQGSAAPEEPGDAQTQSKPPLWARGWKSRAGVWSC